MRLLTREALFIPRLYRRQLHSRFLDFPSDRLARSGFPSFLIRSSGNRTEVSTQEGKADAAVKIHDVNGSGSGGNLTAPTFQDAIAKLQDYWASVGCAVWLPHNTEVGAGTMNPATFLRVLGPEPWNVCYAEPSIRPDDSRYGDNPNRIQRHTQFQVILKPDPGNPQELYLGSLAALGINDRAHDIRFVEDNWESPVLGAWGLGWEVWMDGMEVTQFTYFQQAGGQQLPVPAVEITYGLERILMALQGVNHFKDIMYNQHITYGELFLQNEFEMSKYNMEEAIVEDHWKRFELYEAEARSMLEKGLSVPAYENLLKCSHTFNILDARGSVGVTERNNCFTTLRNLARDVAQAWLTKRAELGYPLGDAMKIQKRLQDTGASSQSCPDPRLLVLEIGSEEIPSTEIDHVAEQVQSNTINMLKESRLGHNGVQVFSTPRRLAVVVHDLAGLQAPLEEKIRGPPASIAYDGEGEPTKALIGFCKKNQIAIDSVTRESDSKGVEYVFGVMYDPGKKASDVLLESLPSVFTAVSFKKSMRWNSGLAWSRPLRWIFAMHGDVEIPFTLGDLTASSSFRAMRGVSPEAIVLGRAEEYLPAIERGNIILDPVGRRGAIWSSVQSRAQKMGGTVPEACKDDLLVEVANLVEAPNTITGEFDEGFLHLPTEVLVTVMRKHQRYFPVYDIDDPEQLIPAFITIANGQVDESTVKSGNEAVLRARFQDAEFFYNEDLKLPLESMRKKLSGTLFEKSLGNLLDKSVRIEKLARPIGFETGLQHAEAVAKRAARICRADLTSSMVVEMTSLAGTMGRYYALFWGESVEVAEAVFESVLPRFSGDILPASPAGIVVSLADKIDTLVGLVAAGRTPSGSADPFGLRRTAYGYLQTLISNSVHLDSEEAVDLAAILQKVELTPESRSEVLAFVQRRLEQLLCDRNIPIEAVRSVLNERGNDPYLATISAEELGKLMASGSGSLLHKVLVPMARSIRIVRSSDVHKDTDVDTSLFETGEEHNLYQAVMTAKGQVDASMSISSFLGVCQNLVGTIDDFFENVYVMSEDVAIRMNRLQLLRQITNLPKGILDFSELPGF